MSEITRATQAGAQVVGIKDVDGIRVTLAGKIIVASPGLQPLQITSVTNLTCQSATINGSAYSHAGGQPHAYTRVQVRLTGTYWTTLLFDSGWIAATESPVVTGLIELTALDVRMAYQAANGEIQWSYPYYFETPECTGNEDVITYDPPDWAPLWNIGESYVRYKLAEPAIYFAAGGWGQVTQPAGWGGPSSRYNWFPKFGGKAGCYGKLQGGPAALVNTVMGPNMGVNVATRVAWWTWPQFHVWEYPMDSEFAQAGVGAMICGTITPNEPIAVWGWWRIFGWTYHPSEAEMQGIYAYIEPGGSYPFHYCYGCCWEPTTLVETRWGWPGWACLHWGSLGASFKVTVWFGYTKKTYTAPVPWRVVPSTWWWACQLCNWAPWYGVRLKVWKDWDADPTGRTHRIQAAVTTGTRTKLRTVDRGVDFTAEYPLTVAYGLPQSLYTAHDAALPDEEGPWDIDETWVGGWEESAPGEGDGGLRCGWTGYVADRGAIGGSVDRWSGVTVFDALTYQVLDETGCETVCDALYIPPPPVPQPEVHEDIPLPVLNPCPPDQDTADKELYLGGKASAGSLFKFGGYEVEAGRLLTARITPNPVAPEGYGGECLFKSIFVVVEHFSDILISVTPILNGEKLDRYAVQRAFMGPGDRAALNRYEVPLYRQFEDGVVEGANEDRFKYGLRGTYFTFEMEIIDLCGIGLQLPGVWIDFVPVRESQNTGVVYTEDLLRVPAFVPTGQVFMGTKGYNRLLKAEAGVQDDGIDVQARVFTNPVSPAGAGGECVFHRVSLTVKRWNANPMDLKFTPYLDGDPLGPITVHYKATTRPVQEITEIFLNQYYRRDGADAVERFRHGLRGAWFHAKIETGSGLQEWLSFDGMDLDCTVVRESLQTDVRT